MAYGAFFCYMYFSAAHLRHASVTYIFFNSKYSYSMMPKLDRMNVYCLYPCKGILKKSELWQHSDPGWPKEGDNLKFEPCIFENILWITSCYLSIFIYFLFSRSSSAWEVQESTKTLQGQENRTLLLLLRWPKHYKDKRTGHYYFYSGDLNTTKTREQDTTTSTQVT